MVKAKFLYLSIIIIYAFSINWISANIGVMPIDTFAFFDSSYLILKGKYPIKDFWVYTGLVVDYLQAFFFFVFGNNWNSYIIHSSFINVILVLFFYYFQNLFKIQEIYKLFYSISFGTLLYPVVGTPYHYQHAFSFCILALFLFSIAVIKRKKLYWVFLPVVLFFSFFSMQTPTAYIAILIFIFILIYIFKYKNFIIISYVILGSFISFLIFFAFLIIVDISIYDLVYQYFLFPITIGKGRFLSENFAYVKLIDQLNFKRIFFEFKFIHIFLLGLIITTFIKNKKNYEDLLIVFLFITSTFIFLFNQLTQANQEYIFGLIPVVAVLLHSNLKYLDKDKFINFFLVILIFVTIKFHNRYNLERKFMDLEKIDKNQAVLGDLIHKNLKNLKWITPYTNPKDDIIFLNKVISILEKENDNVLIITHYNFFNVVLNKKFNIMNRWYLWDNNSHPTPNHKYFEYYKKFINKKFNEHEIKKIYLIGQHDEFSFKNLKSYFGDKCFNEDVFVKKSFIKLTVSNCKKKKIYY